MPVVIDEVIAQVEPEPTQPGEQPAVTPRDRGTELVRTQLAVVARRAARLHAD